mgnify:CR=1 FL=1
MLHSILGRKLGMTQVWSDDDRLIPVTVIEAGPCVVSQIRTEERDGYRAVQLAFGDVKESRSNKPMTGHFAKAKTTPKRFVAEVPFVEGEQYKLGQTVTVEGYEPGMRVARLTPVLTALRDAETKSTAAPAQRRVPARGRSPHR